MKSKKRVTILCKNDEENNDDGIQKKYKHIENKQIKKKVDNNARKQVIEQISNDESDEHLFLNIDKIKNDMPHCDSSYDLETDSVQEHDKDELFMIKK